MAAFIKSNHSSGLGGRLHGGLPRWKYWVLAGNVTEERGRKGLLTYELASRWE